MKNESEERYKRFTIDILDVNVGDILVIIHSGLLFANLDYNSFKSIRFTVFIGQSRQFKLFCLI